MEIFTLSRMEISGLERESANNAASDWQKVIERSSRSSELQPLQNALVFLAALYECNSPAFPETLQFMLKIGNERFLKLSNGETYLEVDARWSNDHTGRRIQLRYRLDHGMWRTDDPTSGYTISESTLLTQWSPIDDDDEHERPVETNDNPTPTGSQKLETVKGPANRKGSWDSTKTEYIPSPVVGTVMIK